MKTPTPVWDRNIWTGDASWWPDGKGGAVGEKGRLIRYGDNGPYRADVQLPGCYPPRDASGPWRNTLQSALRDYRRILRGIKAKLERCADCGAQGLYDGKKVCPDCADVRAGGDK